MKKQITAIIGIFSLVLSTASFVFAQSDVSNVHETPVVSLGLKVDPQTGKTVEGFAIIDFKKGYGRLNQGGSKNNGSSKCYAYLFQGSKWKTVENYLVDPTNTRGLTADGIRSILAGAITEWEDAADGVVDSVKGANILGNEIAGVVDGFDSNAPDGKNEVLFGNISYSGAIAVTTAWGIFGGPPSARELVEWDQMYDDVDFDWSLNGEVNKMDFENIATHEIGHSLGMDHPDNSCTEETMFWMGDYGEIKKRDLYNGDIAGINNLY